MEDSPEKNGKPTLLEVVKERASKDGLTLEEYLGVQVQLASITGKADIIPGHKAVLLEIDIAGAVSVVNSCPTGQDANNEALEILRIRKKHPEVSETESSFVIVEAEIAGYDGDIFAIKNGKEKMIKRFPVYKFGKKTW